MGLWDIIVPEATTNLCTNPSLETNTTGWAAMAGAIAQDTSDPPFGTLDLKCTPAVGVDDGCYFGTVTLTSGTSYTFSFYFKGVDTITYQAYFATTVPATKGTPVTFTGDGEWHQYTGTWACDGTASHRVYITKNNNASVGAYHIDGLQVEAKAYATTYCDGTLNVPPMTDYAWTGIAHASTSTRSVTVRTGGRVKNLTDDYYFIVLNDTGTGLPPMTNYRTRYALLPGALHEHTKIHERTFVLNGLLQGTSLVNFHARKAALENIVPPDKDEQPLLLRYSGGSRVLEIAAYYEGGLEGGISVNFTEKMGLRFYAPAPDWLEVVT